VLSNGNEESEHSAAQDDTPLHQDAEYPDKVMTKSDLRDLTQRIAHGLRNKHGLGANGPNKDVVTVISYGQPAVAAVYYGVIAAGGVYSAASPSSTVSELVRQIALAKSQWIVCGTEHKDLAAQAAKESDVPLGRVFVLESRPSWSLTSLGDNSSAISDQLLPWQKISNENDLKQSLIVILWSSGTTDLPKGMPRALSARKG
jgi:4-coumarate--CoA ligase